MQIFSLTFNGGAERMRIRDACGADNSTRLCGAEFFYLRKARDPEGALRQDFRSVFPPGIDRSSDSVGSELRPFLLLRISVLAISKINRSP